jgi:inner membrane transporter RhtA
MQTGTSGRTAHRAPAPALVLVAVSSTQLGSAFARTLFDDAGPGGTVLMRIAFAALVLVLLARPTFRGHERRRFGLALAFGFSLAAMNLAFYEAIDRIPLGIAVTIEFAGPLGVAVVGSRRARDFLWVVLAALGILLLVYSSDGGEGGSDVLGLTLALVAGVCWAAYIVLSARVGRTFPGGGGLSLAMAFAALLVLPVGIADGGSALVRPEIIASGFGVAMLASALPYSLELEALRRLPQHVFGVLMSIEPAVAALAGLVVLGQELGARQLLGIALVVFASAGAASTSMAPPPRDG